MSTPSSSGQRRRLRASERLRKTRVLFDKVDVYYFNIAQSADTVPSSGGIPLGMENKHFDSKEYSCREYERLQSLGQAAAYMPQSSDGEKKTKTKFVLPRDSSTLEPLDQRARQELVTSNEIAYDESITEECEKITQSRESCGCTCVTGDCKAETCVCYANGIECQIENEDEEFPCACKKSRCQNPEGRREHNSWRIKEHFLSTVVNAIVDEE
ncbi:Cysteine/serine-rich nuclear protein 3-like protein [Aphelenchoides besseyi]|nr:Cysteine/serine-rich nuclear protein 3-like protein [Aphelenchoides besseyi]KAI6193705.1 Cysteine/serine-rich nuclear protein 3-like protein [Aphelenchoides besseyi]